jgi:gas vesicle protein
MITGAIVGAVVGALVGLAYALVKMFMEKRKSG